MRILARMTALATLALGLAACNGGGGVTTPLGGPLAIALFAGAPTQGASPLKSTLTVNITGGQAPFTYAFDFENDGAFDSYVNASFSRTVSREGTFFYNSADVGGVSTYQAIVRITDDLGAVVTSAPVTLLVQGTQDFMVVDDPTKTFPYSSTQNPDGSYEFNTGQPVFFQSTVTGGVAPFEFHWDFDDDGVMDSNAPVGDYTDPATGSATNTRQFTYTYNTPGARPFVCHLDVVDGTGARAFYDFVVVVNGPGLSGPPPPEFDILLNTSPSASGGVVTISYDPTGANTNLPNQPLLDMSVVVNPDPSKGGVPPYEYYWDFESDGAIDSQAPSPTIPYYNDNIKRTINPYFVNEDDKTFTLEVMVIDSSGQVQTRTAAIRVIRATGRPPGVLAVEVTVDADGNGHPYADVPNDITPQDVTFDVTVTGSTGIYQWQLDIDNDGNPDLPLVNGNPDWSEEFGDSNPTTPDTETFTVTFGPYFDHDSDPNTPNIGDWDSPGYYPCRFSVRSLVTSGGAQEDAMALFGPLSLVELNSTVAFDGNLGVRTDHGMAALWSAGDNGGANGQSLASREIIIVGGAVGTSQLKTEQRLTQFYAPPTIAGQKETLTDSVATTRIPSLIPRRGAWTWTDGTNIYMTGGRNTENGPLASSERHAFNDNGGTIGWVGTTGEIFSGEYSPLYDGCFSNIANVVCGGIVKANAISTAQVSPRTLLYDLGLDAASPLDDAVVDVSKDMITPRYDGVAAVVGAPGVDGRIYVIGGREASGQSVATSEYLDVSSANPANWFWVPAPAMHDPRAGHTAQVIGGKIYVYGGAYFPTNESQRELVLTAEVFDPITGQWSYTVPPDTAVYSPASAIMPGPGSVSGPAGPAGVAINTMMYFGGDNAGGETNNLEEFRYFYTVP